MSSFENKKICIVGKGISGKGAFALATEIGARPYYYDGKFDSPDLIVVSPGVTDKKVFDYAADNDVSVIGELEFAYKCDCAKNIIAVTGTNGKTTTTELIGRVMACDGQKVEVCGNIGIAYSSRCLMNHDVTALEVSSFQLMTVKDFSPHIAIITNISPDHIDVHGSYQNYIEAKLKICKNQTAKDFLIVDKSVLSLIKPSVRAHIAVIGEDVFAHGNNIIAFGRNVAQISEINLDGVFLTDALFAVAAAKLCGTTDDAVKNALKTFVPPSHRLENLGKFGGKTYYDDSKGTNIGATLAACSCMKEETVLIAGGSYKGYGYEDLIKNLPPKIKYVVAFGAVREMVNSAAKSNGYNNIIVCEHLPQAVAVCKNLDVKNVLLSPASASFDDYSGYDKRGEHFKRLISEG